VARNFLSNEVTLNWLKQYVDFNWSPEELTERLTMLGLEVEGIQKLGGELKASWSQQVHHARQTSKRRQAFALSRP